MSKLLRALGVALLLVLFLLGIMAVRASTLESRQPPPAEPVEIPVDADALAARFAEALRFPTISNQDRGDVDVGAFLAFHDWLRAAYPRVHHDLARETVNELSLLYSWQGREPDLAPVVLMGHMDVVPVIPGTEEDWTHPPFAGVVADGLVWGRGALDDKSSVIAILEAVERLLAEGFVPRRTIYLAFGHDEEVGGTRGARAIAATLARRGAPPYAFVIDEGGAIVDGLIPGVDGSVAVVGVAEKGFISVEMKIEGEGGHSSTPPDHTTIGVLAAAIRRLEENQFPARFDGAAAAMFEYLAPEMGFFPRLVFANLWLTRPLVNRFMLRDRTSASMVRTTTAVTMVQGGVKDNVLPIEATAVVNHRILPGQTREGVMERDRRTIGDERVRLREISDGTDPSPVSDPASPAFGLLGRTLRQVGEPDTLIAPYLLMGGTDAKHYAEGSDNVYRFLPVRIGADGLSLAHGTDEHIAVDGLVLAVRYMTQLIRNTDDLGS